MTTAKHSEAAVKTVTETRLLNRGYMPVRREGFDRGRVVFPKIVLAVIRETQLKDWLRLNMLHGDRTDGQVPAGVCTWMDGKGRLATRRHGLTLRGLL